MCSNIPRLAAVGGYCVSWCWRSSHDAFLAVKWYVVLRFLLDSRPCHQIFTVWLLAFAIIYVLGIYSVLFLVEPIVIIGDHLSGVYSSRCCLYIKRYGADYCEERVVTSWNEDKGRDRQTNLFIVISTPLWQKKTEERPRKVSQSVSGVEKTADPSVVVHISFTNSPPPPLWRYFRG